MCLLSSYGRTTPCHGRLVVVGVSVSSFGLQCSSVCLLPSLCSLELEYAIHADVNSLLRVKVIVNVNNLFCDQF